MKGVALRTVVARDQISAGSPQKTGMHRRSGLPCRCQIESNREQGVEALLPHSQVTLDHCWVRYNLSSGVPMVTHQCAIPIVGLDCAGQVCNHHWTLAQRNFETTFVVRHNGRASHCQTNHR